MKARRNLRAHVETLACWSLAALALGALAVGATGPAQLACTAVAGACVGAAGQLVAVCLMGGAA